MRELQLKDAKRMMDCLNDKSITETMRIRSHTFTLEECENFIKKSLVDIKNKNFAIVDENDNWVGTVSLKDIDEEEAEYAIITCQEAHGKGYAQKATKEILRYAFNELHLNKVFLYASTKNVRANKFYQKFGWIFDHLEKEGLHLQDEIHDVNWYYITKEDKELYE